MRTNLKVFRTRKNLSQDEFAEIIGCNRATYAAIENGKRSGRMKFWEEIQQKFVIPSGEMWDLMKNE